MAETAVDATPLDGVQARADPSQCLVEDLDLLTASFIGRLGGTARTLGRYADRALAPQQAEVLLARSPEPVL